MKTIELTDDALRNIENMQARLWAIAGEFGPAWISRETQEVEESLITALLSIFRFPGTVHAEDDLSLIICSYITLGVIWHPKRIENEQGDLITHPLLGTWSTHS